MYEPEIHLDLEGVADGLDFVEIDGLQDLTGLEGLQETLHGQQGVNLAGAEPQARKLPRVRIGLRVVDQVAAAAPVPDDRHAETVPQVLQVPFERGPRDLQLVEKPRNGYRVTAGLQQVDDLVLQTRPARRHLAHDPRWKSRCRT